jgi:hypothetical protein
VTVVTRAQEVKKERKAKLAQRERRASKARPENLADPESKAGKVTWEKLEYPDVLVVKVSPDQKVFSIRNWLNLEGRGLSGLKDRTVSKILSSFF